MTLALMAVAFLLAGWLLDRKAQRLSDWKLFLLCVVLAGVFVWVFMLAWVLPRAMGYV